MIKRLMLITIRVYQVCLSSILGPSCRFYPTCSEYTRVAIEQHGVLMGSKLGVQRICKCHPFNPGGVDLVPPALVPNKTKATPSCSANRS